jgi:hypothetical protein
MSNGDTWAGLTLPPVAAGLLAFAARPGTLLKNSSGFGGSNVCLVLRQWPPA